MAKRYVSTGEAAAYLGITRNTLHNWVADGIVTPTWRTPRRGDMRWDLEDLDRQLHNQPTGARVTERSDLPEPEAIVAAIVTSDRGILVSERRDQDPPWGFVTGKIEPGESPADAAVREVKEETGLRITAGKVIGRRIHPRNKRPMVYMAAKPSHGTDVFVGDRDELKAVRWVSLAEADDLTATFGGIYEPVRDYLAQTLSKPNGGR
jgi:8-oxo-dGTP diphosphatase